LLGSDILQLGAISVLRACQVGMADLMTDYAAILTTRLRGVSFQTHGSLEFPLENFGARYFEQMTIFSKTGNGV
jgi:hypothetical protein